MLDQLGREPLNRRDWVFIAICLAVSAISIAVIANWFSAAFPEASIDFRYDHDTSRKMADTLLASQRFDVRGMKHTVVFDSDDAARIFLERSLGLKRANEVIKRDVRLWVWHHRWFRPLQEEEFSVDVAPTGEIVSMTRKIPESRVMPMVDMACARPIPGVFLARVGGTNLDLISQSERKLPGRVQRIFTWRSRSVHPAGAEYRHAITVDGDSVSSYEQRLKVPDEWLRGYRELRSKNNLAGNADRIFLAATMLAALAVFVGRLRRGDLRMEFLLGLGAVTFVLSAGANLNSFPSAVAGYDTTTSYPAFIAKFLLLGVIVASIGAAMLLIVIAGAGEVLFRERLPQQLALPKVWTPRGLTSKRIFRSLILGYTLVAFFIGYQTIFYVIAEKFGAWAPAEIPYDDSLLNTSMPWIAILFAGLFPAVSEEFLSRGFSIPFFDKLFKSRILAIVVAAYIWGFGHSTYPNQPFYIRGVEVGTAGVVLGFLMQSFGLLPLLIWHYTVDALYTALMLFRSGNLYYEISAGISSFVFAIPLIASIVLYVRNRGFVPDDDLSNATLPVSPAPAVAEPPIAPLPEPVRPNRRLVIVTVVAIAAAVLLTVYRPASPSDVIDYRITGTQAKSIATAFLRAMKQPLPAKIAAFPVSAFRSWDGESPREDGGSPGGFDEIAATYMVRHGLPVQALVSIMGIKIPTATWMVRFFTPMQKTEYFVEVDPRTSRVAGYHRYTDERAPGPRLDRDAALAIAIGALPTYGAQPPAFELKDALAFQQPNRRDWLFQFEDRQPLVAQAVRRATVRVMGAEVSQFAITVKVPDTVYRDAHKQTFLNVVLLVLRLLAAVAGLALVVIGFIVATRHGSAAWQRALRFTLLLGIIPIVRAVSTSEMRVFTYDTTTSWDTFLLNAMIGIVFSVGMQLVMLFIALAAIFTIHSYATSMFSTEGRRRLGRHAAVATLGTISLLAAAYELLRLLAHAFPSVGSVGEMSIPDAVFLPVPALLDVLASIFGAVIFAGAAALVAVALSAWKKPSVAPVTMILILFFITIDSSATLRELPLTILTSAILAVLVWLIARYVLDGNPLAWPLTAFIASLVESGASMIQNHRPDLQLQAWIVFAIAAATLIWASWDYGTSSERFSTAHAPGD